MALLALIAICAILLALTWGKQSRDSQLRRVLGDIEAELDDNLADLDAGRPGGRDETYQAIRSEALLREAPHYLLQDIEEAYAASRRPAATSPARVRRAIDAIAEFRELRKQR
ncbi:hypothetical protein [Maricaulis sp. CAU 1757]